ncbi:MAG: peptidase S8 [Armatimonadetes bacterium]|nr:peptidase S8 [Armatimonadota bacterium]MDE2206103.1 peptidase S8 [Armatimonadota bacterium]
MPSSMRREAGRYLWTRRLVTLVWMAAAAAVVLPTALRHKQRLRPLPGEKLSAWIVPGRVAVQLRHGETTHDLLGIARLTGASLAWDGSRGEQLGVAVATVPPGAAALLLPRLRHAPGVVTADRVHIFAAPPGEMLGEDEAAAPPPATGNAAWSPNDPRYSEQWNFRMLHAEQAWSLTRGKGAVAAVIDTGVASADSAKGRRAEDFGATRFVPGWDFVHDDNTPYDDNGHGTHVAGTIAESTDNGIGAAGLAFHAAIMPIKVLSASGGGTSDAIAEGIRWAADHGANIINMSLGGPFPDKVMESACRYAERKGVTIVCAAGNSGREGVGYPAAFPGCIAVSSVGPTGKLAAYSSWGKQVAIAAPGGDTREKGETGGILQNTIVGGPDGVRSDGYYWFQGTSMASPHVAAVAALLTAEGISSPGEIRAIREKSAAPRGDRKRYGAGLLDAGAAVQLAHDEGGGRSLRLAIALLLLLGCCGYARLARPRAASWLAVLSFGAGLVAPDIVAALPAASAAALLAQGALAPLGLLWLIHPLDGAERRMAGWAAAGTTSALMMRAAHGTLLLPAHAPAITVPLWVAANLAIGVTLFASGLRAKL